MVGHQRLPVFGSVQERCCEPKLCWLLPGLLLILCYLSTGPGLQIAPSAQQALQMSGAIAIGAMAAVSGQSSSSQRRCLSGF